MVPRLGFRIAPILAVEVLERLRAGEGVLLHQGGHCVGLRCQAVSDAADVFDSVEKEVGSIALGAGISALGSASGKDISQLFVLSRVAACAADLVGQQEIATELRAAGSAEEDAPDPSGELVLSIRCERDVFLANLRATRGRPPQGGLHVCLLRPSRSFAERRLLVAHVEVYHAGEVAVSSSKQLRICKALYGGAIRRICLTRPWKLLRGPRSRPVGRTCTYKGAPR